MIKRPLFSIIIILFSLLAAHNAWPTEFDELDKPPEGAHEGQMLLGGIFAFGWPYGSYIDAENSFVKNSTHTFENDITKELLLSHQYYSLGIFFEYMPVDHLGAGIKFSRSYIFQNTAFGDDYENWKGPLYKDYAVFIYPAFHLTTRKVWDFVFIPYIGYSFGEYHATPVAKQTMGSDGYTGDMKRNSNGLAFGAELNCTIYFTGGLFITLGGQWTRTTINLDKGFTLTNPQTGATYSAKTSGSIDTWSIVFAAGYAFSK